MPCPICKRSFKSDHFKRHLRTHHLPDNELETYCALAKCRKPRQKEGRFVVVKKCPACLKTVSLIFYF